MACNGLKDQGKPPRLDPISQLRLHLFKAITERNERVLCPAQSVPRLVTTVLTIPRVVGVCLVTHTCPHFRVLYGGT